MGEKRLAWPRKVVVVIATLSSTSFGADRHLRLVDAPCKQPDELTREEQATRRQPKTLGFWSDFKSFTWFLSVRSVTYLLHV
eukprot:3509982-Amphidinium_carterae.2